MKTLTYSYQDGDDVLAAEFKFPFSPRPDFPSCGVFAFAKSGSVLVNAVVADLMSMAQVPIIDWASIWYERGIDTGSFQANLSLAMPPNGYCFSGFREIPRSFLGAAALKKLRKIMVVRDARDMLVSRYFSTKHSHGFEPRGTAQFSQLMLQLIQDGQTDIDAYCLNYSWIVNADFFLHRDIISDAQTLIIKYEDFVYDHGKLTQDINRWFNLGLTAEVMMAISEKHSKPPEMENPNVHVRQAHPGDHKRKLKPQTIDTLNSVLAPYLSTFDYL
jgi:hypothetical protein